MNMERPEKPAPNDARDNPVADALRRGIYDKLGGSSVPNKTDNDVNRFLPGVTFQTPDGNNPGNERIDHLKKLNDPKGSGNEGADSLVPKNDKQKDPLSQTPDGNNPGNERIDHLKKLPDPSGGADNPVESKPKIDQKTESSNARTDVTSYEAVQQMLKYSKFSEATPKHK